MCSSDLNGAQRQSPVSVEIPNSTTAGEPSDSGSLKTPKTPADEGIDFFESSISHGEDPIRVYDLQLDPDGGPNKARAVSGLCRRSSGEEPATIV